MIYDRLSAQEVEWKETDTLDALRKFSQVLSLLPIRTIEGTKTGSIRTRGSMSVGFRREREAWPPDRGDALGFVLPVSFPAAPFALLLADAENHNEGQEHGWRDWAEEYLCDKWHRALAAGIEKEIFNSMEGKAGEGRGFMGLDWMTKEEIIGKTVSLEPSCVLTPEKIGEAVDAMRHLSPDVWFMNRATWEHLSAAKKTRHLTEWEVTTGRRWLGDTQVVVTGIDIEGRQLLDREDPYQMTSIYGVSLDKSEGVFGIAGMGGVTLPADAGTTPEGFTGLEFYFGLGAGSPCSVVRIEDVDPV